MFGERWFIDHIFSFPSFACYTVYKMNWSANRADSKDNKPNTHKKHQKGHRPKRRKTSAHPKPWVDSAMDCAWLWELHLQAFQCPNVRRCRVACRTVHGLVEVQVVGLHRDFGGFAHPLRFSLRWFVAFFVLVGLTPDKSALFFRRLFINWEPSICKKPHGRVHRGFQDRWLVRRVLRSSRLVASWSWRFSSDANFPNADEFWLESFKSTSSDCSSLLCSPESDLHFDLEVWPSPDLVEVFPPLPQPLVWSSYWCTVYAHFRKPPLIFASLFRLLSRRVSNSAVSTRGWWTPRSLMEIHQAFFWGEFTNTNIILGISGWLVVWTPLKNISQLGWLFPIYGKIKNVPNHQPGGVIIIQKNGCGKPRVSESFSMDAGVPKLAFPHVWPGSLRFKLDGRVIQVQQPGHPMDSTINIHISKSDKHQQSPGIPWAFGTPIIRSHRLHLLCDIQGATDTSMRACWHDVSMGLVQGKPQKGCRKYLGNLGNTWSTWFSSN